MTTVKDLQQQEQTCIEKYQRYASEAKDTVLKDLFKTLQKKEQKHYDSLQQVLNGSVPSMQTAMIQNGKSYNPVASYEKMGDSPDKRQTASWQQTASHQRSWFHQNIIQMCFGLRILA